jgi:hypothetical protein
MVLIIGLEFLLGWKRVPLYGRFGYVEMTGFLMIKILPSSKLSTGAQLCSIHDRLYNM